MNDYIRIETDKEIFFIDKSSIPDGDIAGFIEEFKKPNSLQLVNPGTIVQVVKKGDLTKEQIDYEYAFDILRTNFSQNGNGFMVGNANYLAHNMIIRNITTIDTLNDLINEYGYSQQVSYKSREFAIEFINIHKRRR